MTEEFVDRRVVEIHRSLTAALRPAWPELVSARGTRVSLVDACAYWLWGLAEDAARGQIPPGPGWLSRRTARLRAGQNLRWIWRRYGPNLDSCRRWIYVPQAKASSWRGLFLPILDRVLARRADLGAIVVEAVASGGQPALAEVGRGEWGGAGQAWRAEAPAGEDGGASGASCPAALTLRAQRNMPFLRALLSRWLGELSGAWEKWPPAMVLLNNDLERIRRATALLGQARGLPVVNVQHGLINRGGQYRLAVSDLHLLWGRVFADILTELGGAPETLRVVGPIRYDGVGPDRKTPADTTGRVRALYAAQPASTEIPESTSRQLLEVHARLARENPDLDVRLRPHPRTSSRLRERSAALAREYDNLSLSTERDVVEAIRNCDVVATVFSTVSIDAAIQRRPTVLLDFAGEGYRFPFDRRPPFFGVEREADYADVVREAAAWNASDGAPEVWDRFDDHVLTGLDGRATERAAEAVLEVLEKTCPT